MEHHEETCHWMIELDAKKIVGLIIDDVEPPNMFKGAKHFNCILN